MKKVEVFDGNSLQPSPTLVKPAGRVMATFSGSDAAGKRAQIPFDENLLSRHLMFLGGIGTGKTNAISQLIAQLRDNMTESDVMIVFDSKGDFYNDFYRHGIDVVISNDEKSVGIGGKADYWNIFNEIARDSHMEDNITEIAKTLFHEKTEKTTQIFFPNAAKDLFSAVLTHCCRDEEDKDFNNYDLRRYLDWAKVGDLRQLLSLHRDLKAMSTYIDGEDSPQSLGVLSELQQMVREVFIGNFRKAGTLSLRQLVRAKGGRIIFIEYDLGIGNMLTPIYRLMFDLAIKEALCRTKSEGSVYFVCDEFKLVPNLQHVDDAVNFGRSLGVKFLIGIQNVEQIYEAYSGKGGGSGRLAKSILSGFSTSVCFRVNDWESREFIQRLHGKNRKKESYTAVTAGKGISEQVHEAHVVEDWDISQLPIGKAIIGLLGQEPFLFQFDRYVPSGQ
ncbi:MAG: type IV secretion system DNA-binding domain-containing protein [Syntrophomonadaceae bacterium]|jgi:type IV secretory pathway TraG/TraD family ATPase VirD4|nr:type IV secretion system DNA-binding domain-containing protein [Syntrophomonadaceae bacterium]